MQINNILNNMDGTPENFLDKQHLEEDEPITIDPTIASHYYNLNSVFESFFPDDSLNLAKYTSKAEREQKSLNDSNYIYGEVVRKIYLILLYIIS